MNFLSVSCLKSFVAIPIFVRINHLFVNQIIMWTLCITPPDFGHGMLFQTLEGKWLMAVHSHKEVNGVYIRVPHLFEVDLSGDKLQVGKEYKP